MKRFLTIISSAMLIALTIVWLMSLFRPLPKVLGQISNPPGVTYVSVVPSGTCTTAPPIQVLSSNGAIYTCNNGTWALAAGGLGVFNPLAYGAKFDAHQVPDATVTNSSATVTCPNSDCHFTTTAAVGQTFWCRTSSLGGGINYFGAGAVPTISTINSDTSVTLSASATSGSAAAGAMCQWGDVDELSTCTTAGGAGCALQNAWIAYTTALANGPAIFQIPCGFTITEGGIGLATAGTTYAAMSLVQGCGQDQTKFLIAPNFNWSGICTSNSSNACFFFGVASNQPDASQNVYRDFTIFGGGMTGTECPSSGATRTILYPAGNVVMYNVLVNWVCVNTSSQFVTGIQVGAPATLVNTQTDFVGFYGIEVNSSTVQPINLFDVFAGDGRTGLQIQGTGIVNSWGGTYGGVCAQSVETNATSVFNSYGENFLEGIDESGTANIHGGSVVAASCGAVSPLYAGATTAVFNLTDGTKVTPSGTTTYAVNGSANGTTYLDSTSTLGAGATGTIAPGQLFVAPGHSLTGACTGVATSSQTTMGLFGTGPNITATTCTATSPGSGLVMPQAGTLRYLIVGATAAGTSASSGAVTVLKNGSTTALTCTVGTGTSCSDTTHSVSYVRGDLISIQFTTQATETLAGLNTFVMY